MDGIALMILLGIPMAMALSRFLQQGHGVSIRNRIFIREAAATAPQVLVLVRIVNVLSHYLMVCFSLPVQE